jgi:hypothetical protein
MAIKMHLKMHKKLARKIKFQVHQAQAKDNLWG